MKLKKIQSTIRSARIARRLTLRDIERLSKGKITNGYLCQVETDPHQNVSPEKLRVLSQILKLNYLVLMLLAGHITLKDLKGKI